MRFFNDFKEHARSWQGKLALGAGFGGGFLIPALFTALMRSSPETQTFAISFAAGIPLGYCVAAQLAKCGLRR